MSSAVRNGTLGYNCEVNLISNSYLSSGKIYSGQSSIFSLNGKITINAIRKQGEVRKVSIDCI